MRFGEHQKVIFGSEPETTSQRMELQAALEGLKALKREGLTLYLYSDSRYLVDCMNRNWIDRWRNRGWKTARGTYPQNLDLWLDLEEEATKHDVEFVWVKGHSGNEGNNLAHGIAYAVCRGIEWREENAS